MHGSLVPLKASRNAPARRASGIAARLKAMIGRRPPSEAAVDSLGDAVTTADDEYRFMTLISHELRTPLNGVLGMAEIMAMHALPDDQRERLRMLQESASTLRSLVDVLIEFSLIESGELELVDEPFDLRALMAGIHVTHLAEASQKGLELALSVGDGLARTVRGDAERIRHVLDALVANAVKFTVEGRVSIGVTDTPDGLRFNVRDTGIGIPKEHHDQIFDSFSQVDGSLRREHGGAGLGLALSHRLCQAMGGKISLESTPGRGSLFSVILPLPACADAPVVVEEPPEPEVRRLRVLAAEDNSVNRAVLKALLADPMIELSLAVNGLEAAQAWEAGVWDLVLMDIQMPVMDGVTATRRIREREADLGRRPIPIIAITANTAAKDLANYRAVGMTDIVAKPINPGELLSTIAAALAQSQAAKAAAAG